MGVLNTDLAKQLQASTMGARGCGGCIPVRRPLATVTGAHTKPHVLLEGTGRIRIGEELHTLEPLGSLLVSIRRDPAALQRHGG